MKRYKVQLSERSSIIVQASNSTAAKGKAWNEIKNGYTYGHASRKEFMRKATAKVV